MSALDRIRRGVVALNEKAQAHETGRTLRKLVHLGAGLARSPAKVGERLAGLQATMDLHESETATWVPATELAAGRGGPFDACDMRHWLALAERAGVPVVPAREILVLDEEDMGRASGALALPDIPFVRTVRKRLLALPEIRDAAAALEAGGEPEPADEAALQADLAWRLAAAMDDVPEGWMVRYARCGPSNLKALAGMGVSGPVVPEVRFGPELEVGPGWVRRGNRRAVHASDNRTVEAAAQGPGEAHAFLARPWVPAARWFVGDDPHRHGSQYAGKGAWPAEWRAFVERGKVVGVAAYYGWCGEAAPYDARMALEVRRRAQAVADEAVVLKAYPRYMDVEFIRASGNPALLGHPGVAAALETFGREEVGCTLDFIEVEGSGPVLLEGGPANTPLGGGHPCAFAGCGGPPTRGNKTETVGVAFRVMDHVSIAEPRTWTEGDRTGRVLPWEEVEALAASA